MRLGNELGELAPGKLADLVLVEGDAEQHVKAGTLKQSIRAVYQNGTQQVHT
jgi:imidazolonepropionase-like amidohydrolase